MQILHVVTDQLEAQITGLLIKNFSISSVKDWQLKIIAATLEGQNTLIIQPTGSGKSLCFQIMPFITGKISVVLTPTISLMKDQCCALARNKISATYVESSQTDKEIDAKILAGDFKLVYLLQCFEVENLTTFPLDGEASSLPDKNEVVGICDTVHFVYHVSLQKYGSIRYCIMISTVRIMCHNLLKNQAVVTDKLIK